MNRKKTNYVTHSGLSCGTNLDRILCIPLPITLNGFNIVASVSYSIPADDTSVDCIGIYMDWTVKPVLSLSLTFSFKSCLASFTLTSSSDSALHVCATCVIIDVLSWLRVTLPPHPSLYIKLID